MFNSRMSSSATFCTSSSDSASTSLLRGPRSPALLQLPMNCWKEPTLRTSAPAAAAAAGSRPAASSAVAPPDDTLLKLGCQPSTRPVAGTPATPPWSSMYAATSRRYASPDRMPMRSDGEPVGAAYPRRFAAAFCSSSRGLKHALRTSRSAPASASPVSGAASRDTMK